MPPINWVRGTLLMRDADGRFTFIHQSIMEWLVAEQVAGAIRQSGGTEILHQNEMSSLMADFLIDLAGRETSMTWAIAIQREDAQTTGGDFAKPNALLVSRRLSERSGMKAGLARYELGELDDACPELKLAPDEPLIPPAYFH